MLLETLNGMDELMMIWRHYLIMSWHDEWCWCIYCMMTWRTLVVMSVDGDDLWFYGILYMGDDLMEVLMDGCPWCDERRWWWSLGVCYLLYGSGPNGGPQWWRWWFIWEMTWWWSSLMVLMIYMRWPDDDVFSWYGRWPDDPWVLYAMGVDLMVVLTDGVVDLYALTRWWRVFLIWVMTRRSVGFICNGSWPDGGPHWWCWWFICADQMTRDVS